MAGNSSFIGDEKVQLDKQQMSSAEELTGKLEKQRERDKLMNSVLENDKQTIEDGKLLNDAVNNSLGSFTPDMLFEQFVKDYSMAKHIFGEKLIRAISGYEPDYIEKNINIPEFRRELEEKIAERVQGLKDRKLIDRQNVMTDRGYELASLVMYAQELDKLAPMGFIGEKLKKKQENEGDKQDARAYRKGDRYRDIAVRKTLKTTVRRGHKKPVMEDFRSFDRRSKGRIDILYALDSSGSMKGKKIESCKKAGIALAFRAIEEKDKVGLMIFGKDVEVSISPSSDFASLLGEIARIRAFNETDLANTIRESVELFGKSDATKHLILLTDAVPTSGKSPKEDTLKAAEHANASGVTISLIGIDLDDKGKELAERIVEIGQGRLYNAKETEDIDMIVLEDYYRA